PVEDTHAFEGSAEEVLRYTIIGKSYLIRSQSRKAKSQFSTPRRNRTGRIQGGSGKGSLVEVSERQVEEATKELLDLKNRYMAATQHWLKTDIVNHEELQIIRRRVFEAIQRKRADLHKAAAAVEERRSC
ncbi:unnamed protein product, partial [Choristocarpus tenellus]